MRSVAGHVLVVLSTAAVVVSAAGCSSNYLGKVNMRSIGSDERLVLYRNRLDGSPIVCAEPNPDELAQQAAILAVRADGAEPNSATKAAPATNPTIQNPKSLETIGLHSTSIQLMREGYYRLCEGLINGAISEAEYQESIKRIDASVAGYMALLFGDMEAAPAATVAAATAVAQAGETSKPRVKKPRPASDGPAPTRPAPVVATAATKPQLPTAASDFSVFDGVNAGQVTWPQWPCRVGCTAPPGWVGAESNPAEAGRPSRPATKG